MISTDRIFLIGFSGSGKSTLGKALARRLKRRFFDSDLIVGQNAAKNIPQIFAEDGEEHFRKLEHEAIASIIKTGPARMVVALGGGAFQDKRNRQMVTNEGIVVYLTCSQKVLVRRLRHMVNRPLLETARTDGAGSGALLKKKMQKLLRGRQRYYNLADIRISTGNKSVSQTMAQLVIKLRAFHERH